MMYKNWKLSHFFLCVVFLFTALLSFVLYGWRTNAPGNIYDESGLDINSPYYDTDEKKGNHVEEHPVADPHANPKGGEPDHEKDDHHD